MNQHPGMLDALVALEHHSGGWAYSPGQLPQPEPTCLALLALSAEREQYRDPIVRGLNALAAFRSKDGSYRASHARPEAVWATALSLLALCELNANANDIERTASFLLGVRGKPGQEDPETAGQRAPLPRRGRARARAAREGGAHVLAAARRRRRGRRDDGAGLRRELAEECGLRGLPAGKPVALAESIAPPRDGSRRHVVHVIYAIPLPDAPLLPSSDPAIRDVRVVRRPELGRPRPAAADQPLPRTLAPGDPFVHLGALWTP